MSLKKNQCFFITLLTFISIFSHNSLAMEGKEDRLTVSKRLTKQEFKEAIESFSTKANQLYDIVEELTNTVENIKPAIGVANKDWKQDAREKSSEEKEREEDFLTPNRVYAIKNMTCKGLLDGSIPEQGRREQGVNLNIRGGYERPALDNPDYQWLLQISDGNYVLKNLSSNEYLDARNALSRPLGKLGAFGNHGKKMETTDVEPSGYKYAQWEIKKMISGGYTLRCIGNEGYLGFIGIVLVFKEENPEKKLNLHWKIKKLY